MELVNEIIAGLNAVNPMYPAGPAADAEVLAAVDHTLPFVENLDAANCGEQRLEILKKVAHAQRESFMALHGCPFGGEYVNPVVDGMRVLAAADTGTNSGYATL